MGSVCLGPKVIPLSGAHCMSNYLSGETGFTLVAKQTSLLSSKLNYLSGETGFTLVVKQTSLLSSELNCLTSETKVSLDCKTS